MARAREIGYRFGVPTDPAIRQRTERLAAVAAVLLGLAVPSLVAGRVPIAVGITLGVALLLAASRWGPMLAQARGLLTTPVALAAGATLALWLASALISTDPVWALQVWGYVTGSLLLATFLYWRLRRDEAARRVFFKALLVGALFFLAVALLAVFVWWEFLTPFRTRDFETLHDARQALKGFGSALPLLTAAALYGGWRLGGAWRWGALAVAAMSAALLAGTGGTAGWLGYLSGALAVGLGYGMARLRVWPARAVAGALVVAAAALAAWVIGNLPPIPYNCEPMALPEWAIDAHRQVIWAFSIDRALDYPWLGVGIDAAGDLPLAKQRIPCFQVVEYLPSHSHNWALELFVETGALGLGAAVATLALYAMVLIRRAALRQPAALAALAIAGAFWGSGLVNFSIWSAWWEWTFLLLTAVILADEPAARARS